GGCRECYTDSCRACPSDGEDLEGADEGVEDRLGAVPPEQERERHGAADLDVELSVVERALERGHARHDAIPEIDAGLVAADEDALDAELGAEEAQCGGGEQALYLDRRRSEAVAQLGADGVDLLEPLESGNAPIEVQLLRRLGDIGVGEERGALDRDLGWREALGGALLLLLHAPDRFLEEPGVGIEAHGVEEAGLFGTEQVAGAAELEVLERDRVAAAELRVVLQDAQPLLRVLGDVPVRNEVAVRPVVRPSHAAAELVELREPELVG